MTTYDDVAVISRGLPEVSETARRACRAWGVRDRVFAWERPFSKADVKRFGDVSPPSGPILAVSVADLGEKEAVLSAGSRGVFTIPHFDGFPAVLVELDVVPPTVLRDLVVDGWLCCAPRSLTDGFTPSSD